MGDAGNAAVDVVGGKRVCTRNMTPLQRARLNDGAPSSLPANASAAAVPCAWQVSVHVLVLEAMARTQFMRYCPKAVAFLYSLAKAEQASEAAHCAPCKPCRRWSCRARQLCPRAPFRLGESAAAHTHAACVVSHGCDAS